MGSGLESPPKIFPSPKATRRTQPQRARTQHGGRLLGLPAEIRVLIVSALCDDEYEILLTDALQYRQYKQMFPLDEVNIYAVQGSLHKSEDAHHIAGDHVAILATCRTIYTEAKPILYNQTKFCIHMRDQFWLNFWDCAAYEAKFSTDASVTPKTEEWTEYNPWLQDPRSIVPVRNIRNLSFDIECGTTSIGRQWTWTAQLKHTLLEATNIAKLHIALRPPFDDNDMTLDQHETDLILESLKQTVKCRGTVTGELALSLGNDKFDPKSYFKMLAGYKG